MTTSQDLVRLVRTFGWRLMLVVMLAAVVTGGAYAVAVSPVGTSMASTARRPPGRPADATVQATVPVTTDGSATTTTDAAAAVPTDATVASQSQVTQARPPAPPAGGSVRGPSLTRGLPELGMHAAAIAVIVLVLNGVRSLWLMIQRRRGGNRAPIFHHAVARR